MRIDFVSPHYPENARSPTAFLDEYPLHRRLPAALAERGHDVSILHLFPETAQRRVDGVNHSFVRSGELMRRFARLAGALLDRPRQRFEGIPEAYKRIRNRQPDIVHVHGTHLHLNLFLLQRVLGDSTNIVLHYHGGLPVRTFPSNIIQQRNLRRAKKVVFTAPDQIECFVEAGLLTGVDQAALVVETSSTFKHGDRDAARRQTGMHGDPVFLSAGRLHPDKDPLTVLRGFEFITKQRRAARLYLYYLTDELLPQLQDYVNRSSVLRDRVHFRGRRPLREMEAVYNSADFLLQASRREFSGCAVIDAMACGVIPVVTDIPSLRTIAGRHGCFFPMGDAEALASSALSVETRKIPERSEHITSHFERELSFDAMARKLEAIYRDVLRKPA